MWSNYPIDLIFGILIPGTTKYNILSEATLWSSHKNVSISLNIILYQAIFHQIFFQSWNHLNHKDTLDLGFSGYKETIVENLC